MASLPPDMSRAGTPAAARQHAMINTSGSLLPTWWKASATSSVLNESPPVTPSVSPISTAEGSGQGWAA